MQGRARHDRHARGDTSQTRDPSTDGRQRVDAAHLLVERVGSGVERDEHARKMLGHAFCRPLQQHAAREQLQRHPACAEHRRGLEHIRPQQRFAARERHDPSAQRRKRGRYSPDLVDREVVLSRVLPPVARKTPAVAATGRIKNEQRQHERAVHSLAQPHEHRRGQRRPFDAHDASDGRIHSAIAFSMGNAYRSRRHRHRATAWIGSRHVDGFAQPIR